MKETTEIYALCDPDTAEIRYVGSAFQATKRYNEHLSNPSSKGVRAWIEQLKARGTKPLLMILETVPTKERAAYETHWIARLTARGVSLLNHEQKIIAGRKAPVQVDLDLKTANLLRGLTIQMSYEAKPHRQPAIILGYSEVLAKLIESAAKERNLTPTD